MSRRKTMKLEFSTNKNATSMDVASFVLQGRKSSDIGSFESQLSGNQVK